MGKTINLEKYINHGPNDWHDGQNDSGTLLCPVCGLGKVFVNRSNPVSLYTSHGIVDYNLITCEATAHDLKRKDFRGILLGLVCGNGHDFMLSLNYIIAFEGMDMGVILSVHSEATKYHDEYKKQFMIYDDDTHEYILDQERYDKAWAKLQADHIEMLSCQEYDGLRNKA